MSRTFLTPQSAMVTELRLSSPIACMAARGPKARGAIGWGTARAGVCRNWPGDTINNSLDRVLRLDPLARAA
jgi:hypothetical protein